MNKSDVRCQMSDVRGFTIIELLVVLSLAVMIAGYAIAYSKIGERQIRLYVEEQKIGELLFRAKSLTLSAFDIEPILFCGYGVKIDYAAREYSVFSYDPPGVPPYLACDTIKDIDTANVNTGVSALAKLKYKLDPSLEFEQPLPADALTYVLFVAPNSATVVSSDPCVSPCVAVHSLTPVGISLRTIDGGGSIKITVSPGGQIDF